MATGCRQRFVHGQTAWMVATVLAGAISGVLACGFFSVGVDLTAPVNVTPRWRSRLKWVAPVGAVVFDPAVVRRGRQVVGGGR